MARLIVLDASVVIAALSGDDEHHGAAAAALRAATDDELVLAATTRAEVMVGPASRGGSALKRVREFVAGCSTVPVTGAIADAAAALKAAHRALSLPDALSLALAESLDADLVWTFDRSWRRVTTRVEIPGARGSEGAKSPPPDSNR